MTMRIGEAERLWHAWRDGDDSARERLILAYMPMVNAAAWRRAATVPRHVDVDDLRSVGTVALVQALPRYNPAAGAFTAFVVRRVEGAMLDELRRVDWAPRRLRAAEGRGEAEVAQVVSLQRVVQDGELIDEIAGDGPDPEVVVLAHERIGVWRDAFRGLPEKQAALIAAFHLRDVSGRDLARQFGVSPSRVSQQLTEARRTLRDRMDEYDEVRRAA